MHRKEVRPRISLHSLSISFSSPALVVVSGFDVDVEGAVVKSAVVVKSPDILFVVRIERSVRSTSDCSIFSVHPVISKKNIKQINKQAICLLILVTPFY